MLCFSAINELNDPFELRPFDLTDSRLRWAFDNLEAVLVARAAHS